MVVFEPGGGGGGEERLGWGGDGDGVRWLSVHASCLWNKLKRFDCFLLANLGGYNSDGDSANRYSLSPFLSRSCLQCT